jgi:hypothetical protein
MDAETSASYLTELDCSNPSHIIKLNVGGCKFTTTVATLSSVAGSYFDALFSGRWKQALTEVGKAGGRKAVLDHVSTGLTPSSSRPEQQGAGTATRTRQQQ